MSNLLAVKSIIGVWRNVDCMTIIKRSIFMSVHN